MTHQLTAIYNPPADPAAFDKHYDDVHTPLAAKFADLQSLTVCRPGPGPDGPAPVYLIAVLTWESEDAMNGALSSPHGQSVVADLDNFAQAGVTIVTGPAKTVV